MNAAQREARARSNTAAFWNKRQQAAETEKDLAAVMVEYAKAVATRRAVGDNSAVWRELAELLHTWCQRHST
ncbi:hypothetical protein ACIQV3_35845 [Streptomyces sp. NPDC099050]|uniref:hypothetical protein n=1 Tax=Streptomyces sp. NPDC099050 TaxID=3366100 RepID=UPI00382091F2